MREIKDIRRDNLRRIIEEDFGTAHGAIARANRERFKFEDPSLLSRYLNGTKNIGTNRARKFEHESGRPRGWMDVDHSGEDPVQGKMLRPLMEIVASLPPFAQEHLLRQAKRLRDYARKMPSYFKNMRLPPDTEEYAEWAAQLEEELRAAEAEDEPKARKPAKSKP